MRPDLIDRAAARVDGFLFSPEPPARLRCLRGGLAALLGLRVAIGPFTELDGQPAELFHPVWFLSWMGAMPSETAIVAIQVAGVVAAVAAVAAAVTGRGGRLPFVLAWLSLLVLGGLHGSRGKIQHNELLLLLSSVPVLLGAVPGHRAPSTPSTRWGWPVHASMATIACIYFLTGAQKLIHGGAAWVLGPNMENVMWRAALADKGPTDAVALLVAERPVLAHLVAASVIVVEVGFPAALLWPRARPWFVAAAVVMHGCIYLTHGLDYSAWAATVVVVFVDWPALWHRATRQPAIGAAPSAPLRGGGRSSPDRRTP